MNTVRAIVVEMFNTLLPSLDTLGPNAFRMSIICDTVRQHSVSIAAAATYYNHAHRLHPELSAMHSGLKNYVTK